MKIKELREFLERNSIGLTIPGMFDVPRNVVIMALEHYSKTKEDVFADWADIRSGIAEWGCERSDISSRIVTDEYYSHHLHLFENRGYWNVESMADPYTIDLILNNLTIAHERFKRWATYEERRQRADIYIGQAKIRKIVFERDGFACKICGVTDNLSLDHVVSVNNNGENSIDNLQVLCIKCNSKKGGNS